MIEIEKKFLVTSDKWKDFVLSKETITQFYISKPDAAPTVRLRLKGHKGFLTLKYPSSSSKALVWPEFEYDVPASHIEEQRQFAVGKVIQKIRYEVRDEFGQTWDVDEFISPNEGLILAEIELTNEHQDISLPDWIGNEVSHDPQYSNQVMSSQ